MHRQKNSVYNGGGEARGVYGHLCYVLLLFGLCSCHLGLHLAHRIHRCLDSSKLFSGEREFRPAEILKLESKQFCIDLVVLQRKFTGQKLLDQTRKHREKLE